MARTKQTARVTKKVGPKAKVTKKASPPKKVVSPKKAAAPRKRSPEASTAALKKAYEGLADDKVIDVTDIDSTGKGYITRNRTTKPSVRFFVPSLPGLVSSNSKNYEIALGLLGLPKKYYAEYEFIAGAAKEDRADLLGVEKKERKRSSSPTKVQKKKVFPAKVQKKPSPTKVQKKASPAKKPRGRPKKADVAPKVGAKLGRPKKVVTPDEGARIRRSEDRYRDEEERADAAARIRRSEDRYRDEEERADAAARIRRSEDRYRDEEEAKLYKQKGRQGKKQMLDDDDDDEKEVFSTPSSPLLEESSSEEEIVKKPRKISAGPRVTKTTRVAPRKQESKERAPMRGGRGRIVLDEMPQGSVFDDADFDE